MLVDVVVAVERPGVERIRDFMTASPEGFGSLEEVADAIAAYNPLRERPRNLDGLRKNVRLGEDCLLYTSAGSPPRSPSARPRRRWR